MKNYEIMYIMQSRIADEDVENIKGTVKEIITNYNGEITEEIDWGKRQLAYKIKKEIDGMYIIIKSKINPEQISGIKHQLQLIPQIIRFAILNR